MRNKRSTQYYLLIYHDSITVFLLPYILSDLLDEVLILPSLLQNVQRYVAPFSLYPRGDLKVVGKSFVMFCVSNLLLNIHIQKHKSSDKIVNCVNCLDCLLVSKNTMWVRRESFVCNDSIFIAILAMFLKTLICNFKRKAPYLPDLIYGSQISIATKILDPQHIILDTIEGRIPELKLIYYFS